MLVRVFRLDRSPGKYRRPLRILKRRGLRALPGRTPSRKPIGAGYTRRARRIGPVSPEARSSRKSVFQARMNRKRPLSGVTIGNRPCSKRIATPASPSGRGGPLCLPQNIAPIPNDLGAHRCASTTQPTIPGRPDHHVHPTGNLNIR